jgi:hypothetical protein
MGKRLCTKGTGSAVPYQLKLMRALAPEVRLLTIALSRFGPFVLTSAKNRTSAAKAVDSLCIYGTVENGLSMVFITLGEPPAHGDTAEPVPFVKSPFPIC